jgi:hypothetical protein
MKAESAVVEQRLVITISMPLVQLRTESLEKLTERATGMVANRIKVSKEARS